MFKTYFILLITACFIYERNAFKANIVVLYIEDIEDIIDVLSKMNNVQNISKEILPNIYTLTKESIQFHNVYGEVSSTSNFAALLTGTSAVDLGIIRGKLLPFDTFPSLASTGSLKQEHTTTAKILKNCGYRTWFSGYWKLGLGVHGDDYPIKHGFDSWMGIAHPHNEWCYRKGINNKISYHPYVNLFYKTSFLWTLIFLLLTTLVWFKFVNLNLYVNLLIYTFSTCLAFYVLLHLCMIQRSASCVLYYHDFIYQQPYEMKNLTLHFTQHSKKLIDIVAGTSPFYMVLNYIKMKQPLFHSNYFRTKSIDTWSSAMLELDWSVGEIVKQLKDLHLYEETVIILTGNKNCDNILRDDRETIQVYERYSKDNIKLMNVSADVLWNECLRVPLFIKDVSKEKNELKDVDTVVSITDLFHTTLDIASCYESNNYHSKSLMRLHQQTVDSLSELDKSVNSLNIDKSNSVNSFADYNIAELESSGNMVNNYEVHNEQYMKWVIESVDEEATVEVYEKDNTQANQRAVYNSHKFLFHYYDIQKPAAVTYKGKYQIIYKYLDKSGSLQKLRFPVIRNLHSFSDVTDQPNDSSYYEEIYRNITDGLNLHIAERQDINPWSSQFEMPVYPWLLPCANFPHCETNTLENDDFSALMASMLNDG